MNARGKNRDGSGPLTAQQRAALDHLRLARSEGRACTTTELGQVLGTSPEGAAATAMSLVRRGFAERFKHGRVMYTAKREVEA